MDKELVRNKIIDALYTIPQEMLKKHINKLLKNIIRDSGLPSTGVYCLIHRGRNFVLPEKSALWLTEDIYLSDKYENEFNKIIDLQENLSQEKVIISNHMNQLLNNCENINDLSSLLNENIHKYIFTYPDQSRNMSDLAKKHKQFIDNQIPNRNEIIQERFLTNILIKNL